MGSINLALLLQPIRNTAFDSMIKSVNLRKEHKITHTYFSYCVGNAGKTSIDTSIKLQK